MSNRHPVETLLMEHRAIERVLSSFEEHMRTLDAEVLDSGFCEQALEFFCSFADGIHHQREEELLFPALIRNGVPCYGGPVGVMLEDHETGRFYLRSIRAYLSGAKSGDVSATAKLQDAGLAYAEHMRKHIHKEDHVLFRMAHQLLPEAEAAIIQKEMERQPVPERFFRFAENAPVFQNQ